MTEEIYLKDCYIKEFDANIVDIEDNAIVLDKTAFYPLRGGVANDTGKIIVNNREFLVEKVLVEDGKIKHYLNTVDGLRIGDKIRGIIDWERRYKLMRMHTAAHLLSAVIFNETSALIGSGKVDIGKSYLGFTLENYDKDLILKAVEKANELIKKGAEVKFYFMKYEDAMKDKDLLKLASKLPPKVEILRIVEIEGIDKQICGGPHVKNIKEIKEIIPIKIENKGKGNRRIYYTVI